MTTELPTPLRAVTFLIAGVVGLVLGYRLQFAPLVVLAGACLIRGGWASKREDD